MATEINVSPGLYKIGIWLQTNSHFKDHTSLFVSWISLALLSACLQFYSTYEIFMENGLLSKAYFSLSPGKSELIVYTCEYSGYHIMLFTVLTIMHVNELFENILLI